MKKKVSFVFPRLQFIFAALLSVSLLAGCGQTDTGETEKTSEPEQSSVENTDVPTETEAQDMESESAQSNAPIVYMTTDISPERLKAAYDTLGWQPTGNVAVKLSTGEAGNEYYPKIPLKIITTSYTVGSASPKAS